MLKPKPLRPGSRIALIAPASVVKEKELNNAKKSLKLLKLEPVIYPSCSLNHGYLAGTDIQRLKDLHDSFQDPSIDGIFCLKGGYGSGRLLKNINFDIISKNPKLFLGYSDISVLHIAINQICELITIHGIMPSINWEKTDTFTIDSLKKCLFGFPDKPINNPEGEKIISLVPGCAEGIIIGGNLSLLVSTLGSPYEINTKGKILFLEDIDEKPYNIDRMLNALSLAGKFSDCVGIILGSWINCEETDDEPALTLRQVFEELIVPFNKPTILNFRAGHTYPQIAFPMGSTAILDADNCRISFK